MNIYIPKWLIPPTHPDESQNRIAQMLFQIHIITLILLMIAIISSILVGYWLTPLLLIIASLLVIFSMVLNHRKYTQIATLTFLVGFLFLITYLIYIGQGIHDEGIIIYPILVVMASLLLTQNLFILITILSVFCAGFVTWAEMNDWINTGLNEITTPFDFIVVASIILFTAVIMYRVTQILNATIERSQKSEARWRSFTQNAPIRIINTTLDGTIDFINANPGEPAYDNVVGRPIFDFAPKEKRQTIQQAIDSVLSNKKPTHFETEGYSLNQDIIWFDSYIGPVIEDQQIKSLLFNIIDMTDKKQMQLQLKNSERRLRNFVTQSTEAIWMIEYKPPIPISLPIHEQAQLILERGIMSECNEAGSKAYGFANSEEAIGVTTASLRADKDIQAHFNAAIDFINDNYKITGKEFRHLLPNGKLAYVLTNSVGIIEDGYLIANWGAEQDITALKEAEQTLRTYADELERSNNELQEFAYIASHDLQEPLRKIQTFSDRLAERYADQLEGRGLEYLQRMESAAARMQHLIEDLLAYSRVTTQVRPFIHTNLNQILQIVLSDLEPRIQEENATIYITNLPEIDGDEIQLIQLFQNLITNAIKFHKEEVDPIIHIQGKIEGEMCLIEVSDNGIGFDEKYLDRIFNMFQRLHTRTNYEGTGVGLAVCRRIVERHGGKISATSQIDEGATFIIHLPIKQKG